MNNSSINRKGKKQNKKFNSYATRKNHGIKKDKWFIYQRIEELKRVYLYGINNQNNGNNNNSNNNNSNNNNSNNNNSNNNNSNNNNSNNNNSNNNNNNNNNNSNNNNNGNNSSSTNDYEQIWSEIRRKIKNINKPVKCEKQKKNAISKLPVAANNYEFIDTTLLHTFRILGKEIMYLVNILKPSKNEIFMRRQILKQMQRLCHLIYSNSYMMLFGSCNSKLDVYQSDMDLCIYTSKNSTKKDIHLFYTVIKESSIFPAKPRLQKILHAKVPILKCYFPEIKLSIDISFNQLSAITSTVYIQSVLKKKKQIRYIFIFFKMLLSQYDVNDASTGGISSYNFFLVLMKFISTNRFVFERDEASLYIGEVVYKFCVHLSLFKDQSMLKHFLRNSHNFDLSKLEVLSRNSGNSIRDETEHIYSLFNDIFCSFHIQDPINERPTNIVTFSKIFKMRRGFKEAHETITQWILRYAQTFYQDMCSRYKSVTKGVVDFLCFLNHRSDHYMNMDLGNCYKKVSEEERETEHEETELESISRSSNSMSTISKTQKTLESKNGKDNRIRERKQESRDLTFRNGLYTEHNSTMNYLNTDRKEKYDQRSTTFVQEERQTKGTMRNSIKTNHSEEKQISRHPMKRELLNREDSISSTNIHRTIKDDNDNFEKMNINEITVNGNFIRNINTFVRNAENPLTPIFDQAMDQKKEKSCRFNEERNYMQLHDRSLRVEPMRMPVHEGSAMSHSMHQVSRTQDANPISKNHRKNVHNTKHTILEKDSSELSGIIKIHNLFSFIDDHEDYHKEKVYEIYKDFDLIAKLLELEPIICNRFQYYYHLKKYYNGNIHVINTAHDKYSLKEKEKNYFMRIMKVLKNYDEDVLNKYEINTNIYT